jgi:molecular chaperone GrpE (heat shock protein)
LGIVPETRESPEAHVDVETLRTALAELQDAKRRVERDAERQAEILRRQVLERLIPVLDNLERSIAAAEDRLSAETRPLLEGMLLVHGQFLRVLAEFGLERVSALGQRFDPGRHDAVAVVPISDPSRDGFVVNEIEPAYELEGRVIRPARVEVGRYGRRPSA